MGRPPKVWWRTDRNQWFATIDGKKTPLGPDRKVAEREFHRLKAEGQRSEIGTLTTWVLVERYLDWSSVQVKPVTHKNYRAVLQDWLDSYGSLRAAELRPFHVTRWLELHAEREIEVKDKKGKTKKKRIGWGRSTQSLHATIVKIWSAWCQREGYLDVDRLRPVKVAGIERRKPADPEAITRALAAVKNPYFADFLTVLRETACRPGEIRSLEATRIDFKACVAEVRGKRGPRVIGLSQAALGVLRRYAKQYPNGPILRNRDGEEWGASEISHRLGRVCTAAGIEHLIPYQLRHDYYRRASRAGVPDVIIARQLGHRTLHQLISRYGHPDAAQLASAVEAASTSAPKSTPRRPRQRAGSRPKRAHRKR